MNAMSIVNYLVFFFTFVGIYAILALGLNVQWGFTGQVNIGIAGFYSVGAYTTGILTSVPSKEHLGGFGLPFLVGVLGAMLLCGILALLIGLLTQRLRGDYLAIASIGIAQIIVLFFTNAGWLAGGVRGLAAIPMPLSGVLKNGDAYVYLGIVAVFLLGTYLVLELLYRSPWVRVLRAIRANEDAVLAVGKDVLRFRVEAFVLGSILMGMGGALYAHFTRFISPEAFDPLFGTFIIWVMLISGGSGNNRGAVLGTLVIWVIWSGTQFFTTMLPSTFATQASALRVFLIGALLEIVLILRPKGLLPERAPRPVADERKQ